MSSSKIKVDPRTFKIINQAQTQSQSQSQTTTETFTSDQESSTSVNSDTESVKVIKLDSSEQSGGLSKQNGPLETVAPQVRVQQTQDSMIKPATSTTTSTTSNLQKAPITKPAPTSNPSKDENNNQNLFNYLSINSKNLEKKTDSEGLEESEPENTDTASNPTTILSDNEEDEKTLEQEETKPEPQAEDTTQDVFDLTQNKLYQVLSKLFEDSKGNNISENLEKLSKLFEAHNQIMEKMLNQLIIMNTNYKQVKVPDVFQSSTKQAGNITEFRKKIDQLDQKPPQKKD